MQSFTEYATKRQINKKLIDQYGKYKIYVVDGEAVRDISPESEEFGLSSIHAYLGCIPKDEIWIEDDVKPEERDVLIHSALYQLKQIENGVSPDKAYESGVAKEKNYREALSSSKKHPERTNEPAADKIYVRKYGRIKDEDIDVWLVDGENIRDRYKTDFMEGGHGFVYGWIKNDEIWLENGIHEKELPYILLHEYVERIIMKYKKMSYDKAHSIAAKVEFVRRPNHFSKKQAIALTRNEAEKMAAAT